MGKLILYIITECMPHPSSGVFILLLKFDLREGGKVKSEAICLRSNLFVYVLRIKSIDAVIHPWFAANLWITYIFLFKNANFRSKNWTESYWWSGFFQIDDHVSVSHWHISISSFSLHRLLQKTPKGVNLVTLDYSDCTAVLQEDGTIFLKHEVISDVGK